MTPVDPIVPGPTPVPEKSLKPTRKWIAAQVTLLATLAGVLLTGDKAISDQEVIAIIGFGSQALVTFLIPNKEEDSVGGVPVKGTSL